VSVFEVRVADRSGQELDEVPWSRFSFSDVLSDVPGCTLEVPKSHPKCTAALLACGEREIHVYRDAVLAFAGPLWSAAPRGSSPTISFAALGFFSYLDARFVDDIDQVFTDADELDIAWGLIDYTQSKTDGDLGIIRDDDTPSGVIRSETYAALDLPVIGSSIRDLAGGTQGFDWAIVSTIESGVIVKRWRVWYPGRGHQSSAVIELGKNVQDYDLPITALGVRSTTAAAGTSAAGDNLVKEASSGDAGATFGLLEGSTSYSDISDEDLLQDLADDDLVRFGGLLEQPTVELKPADIDAFYGAFEVGDTVRVRIQDPNYVDIDDYWRLVEVQVEVSETGQEKVTTIFDQRATGGTARRRVPRPGFVSDLASMKDRLGRIERIRG
jgi:hypothetical protein